MKWFFLLLSIKIKHTISRYNKKDKNEKFWGFSAFVFEFSTNY